MSLLPGLKAQVESFPYCAQGESLVNHFYAFYWAFGKLDHVGLNVPAG